MNDKYNLLEEAWIDVIGIDNTRNSIGIKELLLEAHHLLQVIDNSLLMQYGIYRFLIALVSDMLNISTIEDIEEILNKGYLPSNIIKNYCADNSDKFYLFSEDRPFFQNPRIKEKNKKKSVTLLFQILPSGNNIIHFFHKNEKEHAISPAACAKALCALTPFTVIGGRGYKASINGRPPWYILIKGKNLFETIILNCTGIHIEVNDNDAPVLWKEANIIKNTPIQQTSTLQGLTWLPRYIYLYPGEKGICTYSGKESEILVSEIEFEQAWSFEGSWIDPHVSYIKRKKGWMPLIPFKGKSLWRDIGPLMLMSEDTTNSSHEIPIVVKQFKILNHDKDFSERESLIIQVYGIRTDKAKFIEWNTEILSLPLKIVMDRYLEVQVQPAIDLANQVERILYSSIKFFAQNNDTVNGNLKSLVIVEYWRLVERSFKEDFIIQLESQNEEDIDARGLLQKNWKKKLRNTSKMVLELYLGELETNAKFLKRKVETMDFFMGRLITTLFPKKNLKKREKLK
ncbi:MAG TPA: type I-E CRISPR-associated protein Cse1/CasA [bacterium]|nr:type I-E CRISPR-associated protein Cse1/CasA [bacterium]